MLDASGSIGEESFKKMKNVIKKLLEIFPNEKDYRHATVVYGEKPSIVFNNIATWKRELKTDDLTRMVEKIPYYKSSMTRINAALRLVHRQIFPRYKFTNYRPKVRKHLIECYFLSNSSWSLLFFG